MQEFIQKASRKLWVRARGLVRHVRTGRRLRRARSGLRLHLGCGQRRLPGFINIDHNFSEATDYVSDITRLPCPDGSVERIETYHVIEHIPEPVVRDVLSSWRRLLQPAGVLVIECPDLDADIREYMAGNRERLYSIFGRQRFPGDAHHWGYSAATLTELLEHLGYTNVRSLPPTDYHADKEPCIRVEAEQPRS